MIGDSGSFLGGAILSTVSEPEGSSTPFLVGAAILAVIVVGIFVVKSRKPFPDRSSAPRPTSAPVAPKRTVSNGRIVSDESLARLTEIGRVGFTVNAPYMDVSDFYLPGFLAAGAPVDDPGWSQFVDSFVAELNMATMQMPGWATVGAFYVAKDFVKNDDWAKPNLQALLERALIVLSDSDVGAPMIPGFAMDRWIEIRRK